jgi:hypothetical protein
MKQPITIEVDSELLEQAKLIAEQKGVSVSDLIAAKLQEIVHAKRDYARARRRALAQLRRGYDLGFTPAASRDELHER